MFQIIVPFFITLLTQLVKRFIKPKFGTDGIQIFVFLISVLVAVGYYLTSINTTLLEVVKTVGINLAVAITFYEVIIKKLE